MRLSTCPDGVRPSAAIVAELARRGARHAAHEGEGVRVLLLRHHHARARVTVREVDEPELARAPDLEVLRDRVEDEENRRRRAHHLDRLVRLPHGVACVRHHVVEAEERRETPAVERPARAVHRADAGRARVRPPVARLEALEPAEERVGEAGHR